MTHINLNTASETVRQVILSFPANGTVFELDGEPVACLIPPPMRSSDPTGWTNAKNARRFYLIDKSVDGTISTEEMIELNELQLQMGLWLDRVAPLPMEQARKLHSELIELVNQNSSK